MAEQSGRCRVVSEDEVRCELPRGHGGDHRAELRQTWRAEVTVRTPAGAVVTLDQVPEGDLAEIVGPRQARAIVEARQARPIGCLEDVAQVPGVGAGGVARLRAAADAC